MHTSSNFLRAVRSMQPAAAFLYSFAPGSDADDPARKTTPFDRQAAAHEDLPYKVELWNQSKTAVEQVLAVTASGSIGYAAYYAAVREHPERYISLRHKNSIVARSQPPQH